MGARWRRGGGGRVFNSEIKTCDEFGDFRSDVKRWADLDEEANGLST
jgi:hypothetical protein